MTRAWWFGVAAILSFCWFLWLSSALQVRPGSALLDEVDYLLSADIPPRVSRLSQPAQPSARASLSHPLLYPVWGRLGQALDGAFAQVLDQPAAKILAIRTLVALHAAVGFAFLLSVAGRAVAARVAVPLAIVYLLSTTQVLISLPEHMGLSAGLLSAAFATFLTDTSVRRRAALLVLFGLLLSGVTLTNGALAVGALALLLWSQTWELVRRHLVAVLVVCVVGIAAAAVLAVKVVAPRMQAIASGDTIAHQFWNGRLLSAPGAALAYTGLGLVYPIVGPDVAVTTIRDHPALTYEPMTETVRNYGLVQASGALAWVCLLVLAAHAALRDPATRAPAWLLIGWCIGNALFHNFWGDEYFLYSAHWAWALFALVLLGGRALSPTWVWPACALIVAGQLVTLRAIIEAVDRAIH